MNMETKPKDAAGHVEGNAEAPLRPAIKSDLLQVLHSREVEDALDALAVTPGTGLNENEVTERRMQFGENWLPRRNLRSLTELIVEQLRGMIVWLLAGAAVLSFAVGDYPEAIAIATVLIINGLIGFFTSWRAMRSVEALYRLAEVQARVIRQGSMLFLSARELVPGDLVELEAGDIVPADLRLVETMDAHFDESALTGESAPVQKSSEKVPLNALVADRTCMAYKGTAFVRGSCKALVVATGADTELGRISELTYRAGTKALPLEKRLDRLGGRLVWLAVGLSFVVGLIGYLSGQEPVEMIEIAIALAVAAVPEGLPVVATLALARGMLRLARYNTIIRHLSAVETLGSTTLILTDKTGTLTENRMSVTRILLAGRDIEVASGTGQLPGRRNPDLRMVLETGMLCNTASLEPDAAGKAEKPVGSPLEVALLEIGQAAGIKKASLALRYPEVQRYAFDAVNKGMATVNKTSEGFQYAVKGAPEKILENSVRFQTAKGTKRLTESLREMWKARIEENASHGFRLIGLAYKQSATQGEAPFERLVLLGFVCFLDPLRADVPKAIASCQNAGVRVVMMTGDHIATASEIARQAGLGSDGGISAFSENDLSGLDPDNTSDNLASKLLDVDVFARVTPETKLKLVKFYQNAGHVVAMTGDGVNDAPALKQADIGIAMGIRGTQVAREAAAMVLKDDAFTSIVVAMRQGRIIFNNIRRFVTYLMSCNLSEILVVGIAIIAGLPSPLTPLQILFLNLVTDVFPAFALGLGEGNPDVMSKKPRDPQEQILVRRRWIEISVFGVVITITTLAVFLFCLHHFGNSAGESVTAAFLTLALAQLWHVFNMHGAKEASFTNSITKNSFVWMALGICLFLIAVVFMIPQLAEILELALLDAEILLLIAAASFLPVGVGRIWFMFLQRS